MNAESDSTEDTVFTRLKCLKNVRPPQYLPGNAQTDITENEKDGKVKEGDREDIEEKDGLVGEMSSGDRADNGNEINNDSNNSNNNNDSNDIDNKKGEGEDEEENEDGNDNDGEEDSDDSEDYSSEHSSDEEEEEECFYNTDFNGNDITERKLNEMYNAEKMKNIANKNNENGETNGDNSESGKDGNRDNSGFDAVPNYFNWEVGTLFYHFKNFPVKVTPVVDVI